MIIICKNPYILGKKNVYIQNHKTAVVYIYIILFESKNFGPPSLYSLLPLRTKTTFFQMHQTPLFNEKKSFNLKKLALHI